MNILYHFRTQGRGPEGVHIAGIAEGFEHLGHRVDFSSPTGADPRMTRGADPFSARGTGKGTFWGMVARYCPNVAFELLEIGYNLTAAARNGRLLKAKHYDLIYERHAFFLCSTAFLAKRRGVPIVVEINELVGDERVRRQPLLSPLARACDRACLRRADLVTVVSPHLKRRVTEMGQTEARVLVLPNAVAEADYRRPADGGEVRRRFGLSGRHVVGFVGWLVPWHRLDQLLDTVAALSRKAPLDLLLVGDGPLRTELTARADALGIGNHVHFAGVVPHHEVPSYTAAMDIAVIPHSNAFRSPIKLFEYMGQGVPVVAPCTEPIAMVIDDGRNGLLFEPGDFPSFGQALGRLFSDPDLRKTVGTQARADVLQKHTWDHNVKRIIARLAELGTELPDGAGNADTTR